MAEKMVRINRRRTEERSPRRVTLLGEEVSVERAGPARGAGATLEDGVGRPL